MLFCIISFSLNNESLSKASVKLYVMMQDMFLGEMLGAVIMSNGHSSLNSSFQVKPIRVYATGREDTDGQMAVDEQNGLPIKILESFDETAYYDLFANRIGDKKQSAVVGSFSEQKRMWST